MKMSMRATPFAMRQVILHMIGQMEAMSQEIKTGDVARFLNVTKPTAQRYLLDLRRNGSLRCEERQYRSNARCFTWTLDPHTRRHFADDIFKQNYQKFMEQKWSM